MSLRSDPRVLIGSGLLGIAGVLTLVAMVLPWDHPRTHGRELLENWWALMASAEQFLWFDAFYFFTWVIIYFLQILMGFTLIVGACLPSPKVNSSVCFLHHVHLLGVGAVVLAILFCLDFFDENAGDKLLVPFAAGAVLMTVLTLAEVVVYYKAFKKSRRFGDSVHVLPLLLFLLLGFLTAWFLRDTETWHSFDYLVIGIASAVGLGGIWLRNRPA